MLATGLDKVKAILLMKAHTGNFQGLVAMQTADVRTDNPNAWTNIGSMTSADACTGVIDVSADTATALYVRFGLGYNLSSGTTLAGADVGIQVSTISCGDLVGSVTLQLLAVDTNPVFVPVSGYLPALAIDMVKAGIVITGSLHGFKCRLCYRAATITPEGVTVPWGTVDLENAYTSGDGERNTGEIALPVGAVAGRIDDKMLVQFGLEFTGTSAGAQATATVTTTTRSG